MLKLGGYINILIAIAHIFGLFWAEQMFAVTGVRKEMDELAQFHSALPYLLTVFVSIFFFVFGLYGLSAAGKFKKLPLLELGIFSIAGIYIFRGLYGLIVGLSIKKTNFLLETLFSLAALAIGLLFLIGGIKKWNLIKD